MIVYGGEQGSVGLNESEEASRRICLNQVLRGWVRKFTKEAYFKNKTFKTAFQKQWETLS